MGFLQFVVAAFLSNEQVQCIQFKRKRAGVSHRQWRNAAPTTINGPAAPANAKPDDGRCRPRRQENNILPLKPQKKIDAATLTALVAADPGDELDEPLRLVSARFRRTRAARST